MNCEPGVRQRVNPESYAVKERIKKIYNLDTANEKRLCRSLKTEYTFIRYVPAVGAEASATSAIRHDLIIKEKETSFIGLSWVTASDPYRLVNIGLLPIRQ